MNKKEKSTILTKQKVMLSARELFFKKGYTATSISDIVKLSQVSKGNLYYHYENKESIFISLLKQDYDMFIEAWKKEEARLINPKEKLYALVCLTNDSNIRYIPDHVINEFLHTLSDNDNSYLQQVETLNEEIINIGKEILVSGNKEKCWSINDENDLAYILSSFITGLCSSTKNLKQHDKDRILNKAVNVFLQGIEA